MCNKKEFNNKNGGMPRFIQIFFMAILFTSIATSTKAQEMNDELKKQLRQSLLNSDIKHSEQMHTPFKINLQKDSEVLKVSPTTRLPTKLDQFVDIYSFRPQEPNLHLNFGKITEGVKRPSGHDFDPVRAIQNYKARKRKKIVDNIVKIYSTD